MMDFDAAKFFERAGGNGNPADLRALILKHNGLQPSPESVQMWRARNAIPGGWLGPCVYALMKEGCRCVDLMTKRPTPTNRLPDRP